jgi:sodium/bile acid cotransporter 7
MTDSLRRNWFLIALACVLIVGIGAPDAAKAATGWLDKRLAVAVVLFLMAVSLDSDRLWNAVRRPLPAVLAIAINFSAIPLAAWALSAGLGQLGLSPDLRLGLLIAASVPCTLASASVWTRKAKGDDAVTLVVTVTTNLACFVVTPLWLLATTGAVVELHAGELMQRLALVVLVPTVAGQWARTLPAVAVWATRQKANIGGIGQGIILLVILVGASDVGMRLHHSSHAFGWGWFFVTAATCMGLHLGALGLGLSTARAIGFATAEQSAVAFASSQKTLPIGILLAVDYFGADYPLAIFPMIIYHVGQLVLDTAIAQRLAKRHDQATATHA